MKTTHFGRRTALFAAALTVLTASPAYAATTDATAESEILQPLTLTQISVLDFGSIVPSNVAGRVNIRRNDGVCVAQGGAMIVGTGCQRGEFLITGASRVPISVVTAAAPITLSRSGGGATMTMDRVRINGGVNKRLNAAGERTFYVSGRLRVGAYQAEGVYDGTFNVTVDYR
jgi:hypothetical protein